MYCHENKMNLPIIKDLWYFLDGFDLRVKTGTDFSFRDMISKENERLKENWLKNNKKMMENLKMDEEEFLRVSVII